MSRHDPNDAAPVPLARLLRAAADDLAQREPPAELAERIQRAWSAAPLAPVLQLRPAGAVALEPPVPARGGWQRWTAVSGATLCGLALGVSLLLMLAPPDPSHGGPSDAGALRASGFLPLVPPERWSALVRDAEVPAWLVPAELPRERLAALGLPYDPARAGETVRAELLMNPSGDVLAVRVMDR